MKKLILKDMEGFDFVSVYKYFISAPSFAYEIHLEKKYFGKKDYYSTFQNYCAAAYIGQQLFNAARVFTYWVPSPLVKDPFIFYVEIDDVEDFADVIYHIVSSYINYYNLELYSKFREKSLKFYATATTHSVNYAGWGLLDAARDFKTTHDRSEKRKIKKLRSEAWRKRYKFFKLK